MGKHMVILGSGTAGTLTANRLQRTYDERDFRITVVDQDDDHVYQPGLLFVSFGLAQPHHLVRSRPRQLNHGIDYKSARIERVDLNERTVHLGGGIRLSYDALVVASGARLLPEETEGLTGPGWGENVFTFYDLPGAVGLQHALERFDGGRVVIDVADLPVKCPVAPLEFAFLADWYFQRRGIRDKVRLTCATPLDGAFTKPVAAKALGGLLADKGIELVTEFTLGEVDGAGGRLVSYDEREVPFDLAVVVPLHGGAEYVGRSEGLGDELDFVPVDPHTLQHPDRPEVFAIGDAAGLPASKAGSVAPFEGEVLVHNIGRFLAGQPLDASFDGHANCFVETGFHKALLTDFNYETEPLPGHCPGSVGLPLLKESHADHLGKLAFEWLYWHSLLPGRELPGIGSAMPGTASVTPTPEPKEHRHLNQRSTDMPTATYDGTPVPVDDEGFFTDPGRWTEPMAEQIAKELGIDTVTDRHWTVIRFMRAQYAEKGTGPTVRVLGKTSGVSVKELYQLFPKGPAKTAAKIAGIPKPRGCI